MKNILCCLIFCSLSISGFSQFNKSIDLITGIEYSYRALSTSSQDIIVNDILARRQMSELGKNNWRLGLNLNIEILQKTFFKTGLRLASNGYKDRKVTDIRWPSESDGNGGWILDPDLPREYQYFRDYWFAEMPIVGRYHFLDKRFTPFFELGVSSNIYITTKSRERTDLGSSSHFFREEVHKVRRFHLTGIFSFGLKYSMHQTFEIFAQPIIRYHLTALASAPIKEHLYNYGIEFGLRKMMSN